MYTSDKFNWNIIKWFR